MFKECLFNTFGLPKSFNVLFQKYLWPAIVPLFKLFRMYTASASRRHCHVEHCKHHHHWSAQFWNFFKCSLSAACYVPTLSTLSCFLQIYKFMNNLRITPHNLQSST